MDDSAVAYERDSFMARTGKSIGAWAVIAAIATCVPMLMFAATGVGYALTAVVVVILSIGYFILVICSTLVTLFTLLAVEEFRNFAKKFGELIQNSGMAIEYLNSATRTVFTVYTPYLFTFMAVTICLAAAAVTIGAVKRGTRRSAAAMTLGIVAAVLAVLGVIFFFVLRSKAVAL